MTNQVDHDFHQVPTKPGNRNSYAFFLKISYVEGLDGGLNSYPAHLVDTIHGREEPFTW